MSNCYDIEIKMDYFYENDSYEDMLEKKKEFEDEIKDHLNYFKKISKSKKVFLEERVISFMTSETKLAEDKNRYSTDKLVYTKFVENFNDIYGESLIEEQKELLNKYITSLDDNGLEMKIFLNEEIARLKNALVSIAESPSYDEKTKDKLNEVFSSMDNFRQKEINTEMLGSMLKIQNLIHEASK